MTKLLIANNCTRESGSFMGDQLCLLKTCYLFVENTPNVSKVIMSMSRHNEMNFLWKKFIEKYDIDIVWDDWNPGDWSARWNAWDKWRTEREIECRKFDIYKECYLRIHGAQRQRLLCGSERGVGHCIYAYWWRGQENAPDSPPRDVGEWDNHGVATRYSFGDDLIHHPPHEPKRDVYISPHAKTQGNVVFTFDFWSDVVRRLVDRGVTVTVGYGGAFCDDLVGNPLFAKHWGTHEEWMAQLCGHKLVACGNTGTGWLAAACGVPMITMEPPNSQMPDHRYRECGLRNIVEVVDEPNAGYVARRIHEEVNRRVVLTTGCYDVLHAGHVRHLERSKALGTKLVVALNSDSSVRELKGRERPVNTQDQRRAVLEALRCVDEVRTFDGPNAMDLILELRPQVLTAGFGYTVDQIVGREAVESWGGEVAVTCEGDARVEPSTTKILKRVQAASIEEVCRVGVAHSVNPVEKLRLMANHLIGTKHLPGDVADLGACRGGTSYIMRQLLPNKHLHVFDTWEGTPYDDPLCHHKRGEWAVPMEECRGLVGEGDLTHYHRGVFPDYLSNCPTDQACTTRTAEDRQYCFVYVDMDTERATRDAIEFFWPRVVPGGKILVDDWKWPPCAGVEKAILSLFSEEQIVSVPNFYTCIIEKK